MLHIPLTEGDSYSTLFAIDPGSEHLGISIMKVDMTTNKIISTKGFTIVGSKLNGSVWSGSLFGDRFFRISGLHKALIELFNQYKPTIISVESPFYNPHRPQAYGVLCEVLSMIRNTVNEFDPWMDLYLIDPSSVKNAIGAPGNANKDLVKLAMSRLDNLNLECPIEYLDEHSVDAIAVNYTRYRRLFNI